MTPSNHIIHDPLSLLRAGKDTAEIAAILGCKEHTAYNEIHRLRQREKAELAALTEKPDHQKIPYAGRPKRASISALSAE